jgi:hypothetical protein
MSGILGLSKTINSLNASVDNLDKITEKGLNTVDIVETALKNVVDIPIVVASVFVVVSVVTMLRSLESNIIYPALSNSIDLSGSEKEVNARAFMATFIQSTIVAVLAGGFLLYRRRRGSTY